MSLRAFNRVRSTLPLTRTIIRRAYTNDEVPLNTDVVNGKVVVRDVDTKRVMTEEEVARHYLNHHIPLMQVPMRKPGPPYTDTKSLEAFEVHRHKEPKTTLDKMAWWTMQKLKILTHAFFRDKYVHHAVVLETVAAVPGMVGGMLRHFRSLRRMERDHGWIGALLEEAENERMHLLVWMNVSRPSFLERILVVAAQAVYTTAYTILYVISPSFAHRLVGYLEEEAALAYTLFLKGIDSGDIPNGPAPEIAKNYWNLPPDATIRDVVLVVRADECMHRDYNHMLADKSKHGLH
jgi:ubiquinol oxidase